MQKKKAKRRRRRKRERGKRDPLDRHLLLDGEGGGRGAHVLALFSGYEGEEDDSISNIAE